jgi:hypothetical protein
LGEPSRLAEAGLTSDPQPYPELLEIALERVSPQRNLSSLFEILQVAFQRISL